MRDARGGGREGCGTVLCAGVTFARNTTYLGDRCRTAGKSASLLGQVPNRWQERVSAALTNSLATTARGEVLSLPTSAEGEKSGTASADRGGAQSRAWLRAATATAYSGGGHVEGARFWREGGPSSASCSYDGYLPNGIGRGSARDKTIDHNEALQDVLSNIFVSASSCGARRGCNEK